MNITSEIQQLNDTVIKGDYCIGCGACTTLNNSPFKIKMNEYGNYVAFLDDKIKEDPELNVLNICPFSSQSKNEKEIGDTIFPNNIKDSYIGNYFKTFAGYVKDADYRAKGSSGGFGKWLGYTLLKENHIDYFVQVTSNETQHSDTPLFSYNIFDCAERVITGAKSSYYPTTLVEVIKALKKVDGRYAITGVPCFIKTLRLMSIQDKILKERIAYTIGIVCGGMKSANQSKMIGWQLGVDPNNLISIDFRGKINNKPASEKLYSVRSNKDNVIRAEADNKLYGTGWGEGYFKPNACDYCDDVVGETADISLGDAWLSKYIQDSKGTSIIIVRNKNLLQLLEKYESKNSIHLDTITRNAIVKSQSGGFRHRREALSYRISQKEEKGVWYPKKRIKSNEFKISSQRKKIYALRETMSKKSHVAFLEALKMKNLNYFKEQMLPLEVEYKNANKMPIVIKYARYAKKIVAKIIKKY